MSTVLPCFWLSFKLSFLHSSSPSPNSSYSSDSSPSCLSTSVFILALSVVFVAANLMVTTTIDRFGCYFLMSPSLQTPDQPPNKKDVSPQRLWLSAICFIRGQTFSHNGEEIGSGVQFLHECYNRTLLIQLSEFLKGSCSVGRFPCVIDIKVQGGF